LFSYTSDKFGKAIKFVTKSPYTHVGIVYKCNEDGTVDIAEAMDTGFVFNSYGTLGIIENHVVKRVFNTLTHDVREALRGTINSMIGRPYDWTSIILIALGKIFPGIGLFHNNAMALICSEAIERVYNEMGVRFSNKSPELITPADIYESDVGHILEFEDE
jgi:hypothetical protein